MVRRALVLACGDAIIFSQEIFYNGCQNQSSRPYSKAYSRGSRVEAYKVVLGSVSL